MNQEEIENDVVKDEDDRVLELKEILDSNKTDEEKILLIEKLQKANIKSECFKKALNILFELYNKE